MKCTKCGHKLRIGDEFCSKCGTPIEPDIIYNENDVREEHSRKDDTRTYRADDDRYKKKQYYYDHEQENEHDITGEIDWDYEDSTTKKASKWTSKGIAAAIGIAVAFVVAIVALNVHNMFKTDEAVDVGEVETTTSQQIKETTTRETTTEAATEESTESGSGYKNPLEKLFPSDNNSGSEDTNGSPQDSGSGIKNPFEGLLNNGDNDISGNGFKNPFEGLFNNGHEENSDPDKYGGDGSTSDHYDDEDFNGNGSSSDYYGRDEYGEDSSSHDHYGSDTYGEDGASSDHYNEGYDYGSGVRDFFEGVGGRIKDGVDNFRDQILEN